MTDSIRDALAAQQVVIPKDVYALALDQADEGSLELIEYLIDNAIISKEIGCRFWSDQIGFAYVDPLSTVISDVAVASIPLDIARKGNVMPLYEINGALTVAMPDPTNAALVERLATIVGKPVSPVFCLSREVFDAIELHYSSEQNVKQLIEQLETSQSAILEQMRPDELAGLNESKPVIRLCDAILYLAIKERASGIHIEPGEDFSHIRFRIDGRLRHIFKIAGGLHVPLTSRVKSLCSLNVGENRFPQEGRFSMPLGGGNVNFNVSIVPSVQGETIVLRLFTQTGQKDFKTLDQMFIAQSIGKAFKRVIRSPNGLVLVTGPTGCGKSTTLYAVLHEINSPDVNICTIENPVEIRMKGITQTETNKHIDLHFSTLLNGLLRQDPDVILVGEINDLETAKLATEAALTGHLVFSTLHTSNAIQAMVRLIELGLEPYMVAPAVLAVMAQCMAARICENCKQAYTPSAETLETYFHDSHEVEPPVFYRGRGCPHCRETGYYGCIAFHEMVVVTDHLRSMISRNAGDEALTMAARKMGYKPLRFDGLRKVLLSLTTIDELESRAPFDWASSSIDVA